MKKVNQGAIHSANNPVTKYNSEHIDVRHHSLREHVASGEFEVVHVSSALQHADFVTKPLQTEAFRFRSNFVMDLREADFKLY